jgi:ABC-2 type transport system ATP-binding protein
MRSIKVENAWVEFSVPPIRGGISKSRQTGGTIDAERGVVIALKDICCELIDGERLGLIGHNGAGKTTMLRLLAGVYSPTRGRVSSYGRISTLFNATPGLNVNGTGRENIVTCGLHLGMDRQEIAHKIDDIIEFSELGEYIDLPVRIYSAGMVTRLGFSIATAVEPEILLLDEGLATGDAQFSQKAQLKMQELMGKSSILVIASHSETLVANICTRCLLLEQGCVIADGPAGSIVDSYRNSVVNAARNNDLDSLHRSYVLATEMVKRGEVPPPALEEQGLRYALRLQPNDLSMWRRYVQIRMLQGESVPPEAEIRLLLASYDTDPSSVDLARLDSILSSCSHTEIALDILARAEDLLRRKVY